jgi:hypothetical protein
MLAALAAALAALADQRRFGITYARAFATRSSNRLCHADIRQAAIERRHQ